MTWQKGDHEWNGSSRGGYGKLLNCFDYTVVPLANWTLGWAII